jgi:hypothetical protein
MHMGALSLTILAGVGVALSAGGAHADKIFKVPAQFVLNACRGRLDSAGGQTGCNRCDSGVCRDYNYSDGSNGVAKGCREIVITDRAPARHPGRPPSSGIKETGGNYQPLHHRHPATLGSFSPPRPGNNSPDGNRQPAMMMQVTSHPGGGGRH